MSNPSARPRCHTGLFVLFFATAIAPVLFRNAPVWASDENKWHVYVNDAVVDTLDASFAETFTAGRWVLANTAWTLDHGDSSAGQLITRWKPINHPLVKLVSGSARVRVAVALKDAGRGRTEVRVLGGIATEAALEGGPVLPLARGAGEHECRGYVTKLRARLAAQKLAAAAQPVPGTPPGETGLSR